MFFLQKHSQLQWKIDEFNYLQFLTDYDQLLRAENQLLWESFPTFSKDFENYCGDFPFLLQKLHVIQVQENRNNNKSHGNWQNNASPGFL